ncbi:hypothetical protein SDC9_84715 [bioreactor metagenome]|uniref:Na(+)/H(+) antiporter subunit F n=1 Tax=bioreactor metagenome TaxID=1076179 RepID=A0A644ZCR7_9ZZZZ
MNSITEYLLVAAGIVMLLALVLVFVRFIMGPSLVDRTIAFDVMTVGTLGLMALISFYLHRQIYLDVSIIYGLLSFVAVIVIGKYTEKSL